MLTLDVVRRRAEPAPPTALRAPCVAVHTEDSQVPRFADRAAGLPVAAVVRAVAPPLIYLEANANADANADANANSDANTDANTALRLAAERAFGGGRISAHRVYQLDASCADPQWIPTSALVRAAAPLVVRVVAFPRALQTKLAALLAAHGVATHPTQFTHELHVTTQPRVSSLFFFGLVQRWRPPTLQRIARGPSTRAEAPCRAFFKLDECLRNQHLLLDVGARALDVGASPGGWSDCLLRHGAAVVAVDPGELTIPVAGRAVVHIPLLLEDALEELRRMDKFALAVCDINVRVGAMAALMLRVAPLLERGARVVFTLKLGKKPTPRAVDDAFQQACGILAPEFRDFRLEWLHANTQNERTLFAIKR